MPGRARKSQGRYWSHRVMQTSNALDLEQGVFRLRTPRSIAASLRRSAERSHRRKSDPYRSAMSMLTFHINRGGRNLSPSRRKVLESAKNELRAMYGRPRTRTRRQP
jgi:hypothetical protein